MINNQLYFERIERRIGKFEIVESLRESSQRTSVYKLMANGENYYLKLFKRRARFEPEIFAYKNWNKAIKKFTPDLIEILDGSDTFGLVMSEVDGTILRETEMSKDEEYQNYRKAGELTRILQDSQEGEYFGRPSINGKPIEEHYDNAVDYLTTELDELKSNLIKEKLLDETNKSLLEIAMSRLSLFNDEPPVPVSWDSTPGNWLVNSNNKFSGMIDFENMRWGIRTDSFGILYERYFLDDMNREKAFFEGYGTDYLDRNENKIEFALIKIALSDIYFGTKFKNDRSLEMGNRLISYLKSKL